MEQARQAAQDNLDEARRFVRALTPPALESDTLPVALERLCATTSVRSGLPVRLHVLGERVPLPVPHEVALLRIAQSALGNTVRHAGAGHAEVTLSFMAGEVALDVVDDGAGFDPEAVRTRPAARRDGGGGDGGGGAGGGGAGGGGDGGYGLPSMRARARALGGSFAVESAPGEGTALAVLLPVPGEAGDAKEEGAS